MKKEVVSILILLDYLFLYSVACIKIRVYLRVSILILLDYLFLLERNYFKGLNEATGLNPYFTGLSILIDLNLQAEIEIAEGLNPYFTGLSILMQCLKKVQNYRLVVSILILLDYLFL